MAISFSDALGVHEQALVLRGQRTQIIATNIANTDTPGFKARDMDVASVLRDRMGMSSDTVSLRTTNPRHIADQNGADTGLVNEDTLQYRTPLQPSLDGNTADRGTTIVAAIQAQIDASTGATGIAGRLTVDIGPNGTLRFTTTSTGEPAMVSIAANASTQGLVKSTTAVGKDIGGMNASLLGNVSLANGYNFDSNGPHTFNIKVDGNAPVAVTLTGDSAIPAKFTGNQNISAGVNFLAGAHSFDVAVNGGGVQTIDLSGVDTTLAGSPNAVAPPGILTHIQTKLDGTFGADVVTASLNSSNFLILTTAQKGDTASLNISNAIGGAAAMMPATGGNVTGTQTGATGVANIIRDAINTALAVEDIASIRVGVPTAGFLTLDSNTYGAASQLAVTDVVGSYGTLFPSSAKGGE